MNDTSTLQLQPGLWLVTRDESGERLWKAEANGITLISRSEQYARVWHSRQHDQPLPAA